MHVTTGMLITYSLLIASILSLWIKCKTKPLPIPPWMVLVAVAFICGLVSGYVQPIAALPLLLMGVAARYHGDAKQPTWVRVIAGITTLITAVILSIHAAPGFSNPKIFNNITISPDGLPYNRYLNFDKSLVGLFILAFGHQFISSTKEWRRVLIKVLQIGLPTLVLTVLLSLHFGYVRLDPKLHPYLMTWAITNLLFTCVAEEAVFRGFIQKNVTEMFARFKHNDILGLLCGALLFGLLHAAGGPKYVVLSTIAGLGYGAAYSMTNRIEAAILTHFMLNLSHFLLFTYPALA